MDTSHWTLFSHLTIWGSIVFYYCFMLILYIPGLGYEFQGAGMVVFSSGIFWFTLLLTTVILILPVLAYRFFMLDVQPSLSDRIRLKQRLEKTEGTPVEVTVHRALSRQQSRTARSGYAFAHEGGFGQLITSGLNMFHLTK